MTDTFNLDIHRYRKINEDFLTSVVALTAITHLPQALINLEIVHNLAGSHHTEPSLHYLKRYWEVISV